ncbi:MAG: dihydropteroate synthase [Sediminimonas sp.]|uniref:dihydropteroate synthase n=1 Tax=Sediminimonas sp. TaxID=2823379 RepID=UPI00287059B2|nr:dihydropteroate synthase [Sediminimonas sp.]MDR9484582.1 dihydropteroate synthase [Sediminimonas sp.]
MSQYYRPIAQTDPHRPAGAMTLAGGWTWFDRVEVLSREAPPRLIPAADLPDGARARLCAPREAIAGMAMDAPRLMGILNITPDSFSDGGVHFAPDAAQAHARAMAEAGADIIDVGGESTRPGADEIAPDEEQRRTAPVIAAMRAAGLRTPISIDTRKRTVAQAAVAAGADLVNDVSGFTFDETLAGYCAEAGLPVCAMHTQGNPQTMQRDPRYGDVVLDVYDFLADRVAALVAAGIPRARIVVDPGIGFGKTQAHNLALLARLSVFHGLGCAVLLGASRKRFIGDIGAAAPGAARVHGSIAVALAGVAQGVQILRVHDVGETRSALNLWQAVEAGGGAR